MLKNLTISLVLIALLVAPMLANAQDGDEMDMEWIEFESESELLTISHPEDWFVATPAASEEEPTGLAFANNEDLLERLTNDDTEDVVAEEGDKGGIILGFPVDIASMLGIPIEEDATPSELVEELAALIFEEEIAGETVEFEETETLEMEDGPAIGIVPFTEETENIEGVVFVYFKDDYAITGNIAANQGEYDEEYQDLAIEMILSYEITVPAEELIEMMMGGQS